MIAAIAGKWFPYHDMIAKIAAIAELFFSVIAAITKIIAIIWKPGCTDATDGKTYSDL